VSRASTPFPEHRRISGFRSHSNPSCVSARSSRNPVACGSCATSNCILRDACARSRSPTPPHPTSPHLTAPHLTAPQLGEAWLIFIPRPRPFHPPATAHRSLALSLSRSLSGRRSYTHLNGHTRSYSSNGLVLPYLRPRCRIICYCQNYCGEVLRKSCRHRRENYRCSFSVLGLAASFFSRNFFFLSVRLGENRIYC
jgi:hypothetical protein